MKFTQDFVEYRQLHIEDYLLDNTVEQEGKAEVYRSLEMNERIDTNSIIVQGLLGDILSVDNLNEARKRVKKNKGSHGIDKMLVSEMDAFMLEHGVELRNALLNGAYKPHPVRRVEIPKDDGSKRKLGIPTVVDRMVQQAMVIKMTPLFEPQFSDNSFGYRPGRSSHGAIKRCKEYLDEGYKWVVDLDLEKFFDTVNQSRLVQIISDTVKDNRVVSLIHKYLKAGVVVDHKFEKTDLGVPQGGPLSPLLSNIMLNKLDAELEQRGLRFVRYADDLVIFIKTRKAAERVKESVSNYIEKQLNLKVNRDKTQAVYMTKVKFLGFSFYQKKKVAGIRVHPKSLKKLKTKVKEKTRRSDGVGETARIKNLNDMLRGWVNHYRIADAKSALEEIDKWIRRRIRMWYWKQWKRIRTRFKKLRMYGIPKPKAWEYANTRKGYWRISNSPILSRTLTNEVLELKGYMSLMKQYLRTKICL